MYTPRGELNDELVKVLFETSALEEIGECASNQEIMNVLGKYVQHLEREEVVESLAVILSYLEEEDVQLLSDEALDEVVGGMCHQGWDYRENFAFLLKKMPGAARTLKGILSVFYA